MHFAGIESQCDPLARFDEIAFLHAAPVGGDEEIAKAIDADLVFGGGAEENTVGHDPSQPIAVAAAAA
jgi:hypothetical protein